MNDHDGEPAGSQVSLEEEINRFEALLADQLRELGADHPDTLDTRYDRAYFLGEQGQLEEAIDGLERLLSDQVRVFGPNHPEPVRTQANLIFMM